MSIYASITKAESQNIKCALCTIVRSSGSVPRHAGSKMIVYSDGMIEGSVGGGGAEVLAIKEALSCLDSGRAKLVKYSFNDPEGGAVGVCGGSLEMFIEPILSRPSLVVIGMGHVGKQVALLGEKLGFKLIISDDREMNWDEVGLQTNAVVLNCKMQEIPKKISIDKNTFIVITTRGNDIDIAGMPVLLKSESAYLGVIGSKRRWQMTKAELSKAGFSSESLERIHSPIGLDIHAETPEEIAVSIMAEIILIKNAEKSKNYQEAE